MPFLTDAIRVVGFISAPVLMATGVGAPLALGIGALATGGANAGADAIDAAAARRQADEAAAQTRERADKELRRRQAEGLAEQARREQEIREQLAQAALPDQIIQACRNGDLPAIPALLGRLTDDQFRALGTTPLAVCQTAEARMALLQMLQAERGRRQL